MDFLRELEPSVGIDPIFDMIFVNVQKVKVFRGPAGIAPPRRKEDINVVDWRLVKQCTLHDDASTIFDTAFSVARRARWPDCKRFANPAGPGARPG